MEREAILAKLKEIINEQLGTETDLINIDSSLEEDLQADSLDKVVMLMSAEKEFDVKFDDESSMAFKTIKDVIEYIEKY